MLDDAVDGAEDVVGALAAAIVDAPGVDDARPAVAATEPARSQGFGGETMAVVVVVCADERGFRWWGRRKQVIPGFARPGPGASAPAHVTALLFVTVTSCHFNSPPFNRHAVKFALEYGHRWVARRDNSIY